MLTVRASMPLAEAIVFPGQDAPKTDARQALMNFSAAPLLQ
tara:strand:+ start:1464 stop:1586 length:123 start_codon:yes stop_codon:yes gene_type:complete